MSKNRGFRVYFLDLNHYFLTFTWLRNYSRMKKPELVAFLTIWVGIILRCAGQRASDKTCMISRFEGTWGRPQGPA